MNPFIPDISVVMPVYNGDKFLNKSIKSVLNQTFENFEFIIINDGSVDESLKIIESFDTVFKRNRPGKVWLFKYVFANKQINNSLGKKLILVMYN